jgi:hypothetical protein
LTAFLISFTEKIEIGTLFKKIKVSYFPLLVAIVGSSVLWIPFVFYFLNAYSSKREGMVHTVNMPIKSFLFVSSHTFILPSLVAVLVFSIYGIRRAKIFSPLIFLIFLLCLFLPLPHRRFPLVITLEYFTGINPFYLIDIIFILIGFLSAFSFNLFCVLRKKSFSFALLLGVFLSFFSLFLHFVNGVTLISQMRFPNMSFLIIFFSFAVVVLYKKVNLFERKPEIVAFLIMLPYICPLSLNHLYWNRFEPKPSTLIEVIKKKYPFERVSSIRTKTNMFLAPNIGEQIELKQSEFSSAVFPNDYYKKFHRKNAFSTVILFDNTNANDIPETGTKIVVYPKNEKPAFQGEIFYQDDVFEALYLKEGYGRVFVADKSGSDDNLKNANENGKAKITSENNGKLTIEAVCNKDGVVVLKDTYDKNWKCYVDGVECPVFKVEGCFIGVNISHGKHLIELKYKPILTIFTLFLSLTIYLTVCLIIILLFLKKLFQLRVFNKKNEVD